MVEWATKRMDKELDVISIVKRLREFKFILRQRQKNDPNLKKRMFGHKFLTLDVDADQIDEESFSDSFGDDNELNQDLVVDDGNPYNSRMARSLGTYLEK